MKRKKLLPLFVLTTILSISAFVYLNVETSQLDNSLNLISSVSINENLSALQSTEIEMIKWLGESIKYLLTLQN